MDSTFAGLEDKGKVRCKCLGCDKELMSIWVVGENEEMITSAKAKCCFCDDDTGLVEVSGNIYIGAGDDVGSVDIIDCEIPSTKGEKMSTIYQAVKKES